VDTRSARHRWFGMVALTVGVSMIIVDSTILNVALPSIIHDLNIRLTTAQWANTIYSLVFAAFLIACGKAGDLIGRRRMFMLGVTVFLGASVLAGFAPSGGILLMARFLQGLGGAIILPSTLGSINATFQGRDRAAAFGIWGAVIGGSGSARTVAWRLVHHQHQLASGHSSSTSHSACLPCSACFAGFPSPVTSTPIDAGTSQAT